MLNLKFIFMDDVLLILLIFIVIAFGIIVLRALAWKNFEKKFKKTNDAVKCISPIKYTFNDFSGLGNEPIWNGTLPEVVEYDGTPRYVYEDLYESTKPSKKHGMVIGYRISPTLVIHSMVASNNCCTNQGARAFSQKYKGKILDSKDAHTLATPDNWTAINKLRTQIGDTPLPEGLFWICNLTLVYNPKTKIYNSNTITANMIMKR